MTNKLKKRLPFSHFSSLVCSVFVKSARRITILTDAGSDNTGNRGTTNRDRLQ